MRARSGWQDKKMALLVDVEKVEETIIFVRKNGFTVFTAIEIVGGEEPGMF
jgi:hypothetical protein